MSYPRIDKIIREMAQEGINTSYDYSSGVTTLTFHKVTRNGNRIGVRLHLEPDFPEEMVRSSLEEVKQQLAAAVIIEEKKLWNPSFRSTRRR